MKQMWSCCAAILLIAGCVQPKIGDQNAKTMAYRGRAFRKRIKSYAKPIVTGNKTKVNR